MEITAKSRASKDALLFAVKGLYYLMTNYLMPYFLLNLSTRPLVSTSFCLPALGADFNGDVLLGGAGLDDVAAGASDGGLLVIGMDSFLHCVKLLIICCHDCAPHRA